MKRPPSELLTVVLAVLACLGFLLGLKDVRSRPPQAVQIVEPVPVSAGARDGQLSLTTASVGGLALGQVTVQAFWENRGRYYLVAAATSDGSGGLKLGGLPRGRTWLLAEAPHWARASSVLVVDDQPRAARLVLRRAESLNVTVHDETEGPIAHATVLVESADPLPFGALADVQGVAHFGRLGPAPWSVKASAPGFESVSRSGVHGDLTLTLRRLSSLSVAVQSADGKPAPDATVMITGATLWPPRSARADEAGIAKITGLLAGSYDLRASAGSFVSPTLFGFELGRGESGQLTLRLEPGRMVVALVTDGGGPNPLLVPDADVVLAEGGLSAFPIRGRTGSDGKVALGPIASGPASLGARAADFVGSALVAVPEVLSGPVRVPLVHGGTVRGEVLDARGFPIPGASIEVVGSDDLGLPIAETPALVGFRQNHFAWSLPGPVPLIPAGELGVMPGPVPPIPKPGAESEVASNAVDFAEPLTELQPWVSDTRGESSARPVTPGRVRVLVRHPDFVAGASELVSLAPGGEVRVKLTLLHGGSLEGRVIDDRGQPVSGADVELSSARATRTELSTSASDGSFAFAAVPAEITVSVSRPDDPSRVVVRKSLSVAEGAHEKLELVLPRERDPVRIVVVDEGDNPVSMVEINATSLEPTRPLRLTRFSDGQGVVELPDALGESLHLVAQAPGFSRLSQSVSAAPKELKLSLKRGVIVQGRITAVRGRSAVSGGVVTIAQEGVRRVATSDADGVYRLRDIAPGEVRVHVEHPEYADEDANLRVEATGRSDRPFELPAIDLAEPGEVEGEVVDERGDRVAGARVAAGAAPSTNAASRRERASALTDSDGHFTLSHVHPGIIEVFAVTALGRGSARAVNVSSGHSTRGLRIQLSARAPESEPFVAGSVAVTLGERGAAGTLEIVVVAVQEGSEAERAGLEPGDVVSALDGARPSSMADARLRMSGVPGSDVVIELLRGGAPLKFRVPREARRH